MRAILHQAHSLFRILPSLLVSLFLLTSCSDINELEQKISEEEAAVRDKLAPYHNTPSSYVRGIDVSHWQGDIDWQAVSHDSISFSYIKVTEGETFIDPKFTDNWKGTKENKIIHGAYHVFTPGDNGVAQAKHFLKALTSVDEGYIGALPPALDIEQIKGDNLVRYAAEVKLWLVTVQQRLGCAPIIYTSPGNWNNEFKDHLTDYRLWLADYDLTPTLPTGWNSWLFWQYTDKEARKPNDESDHEKSSDSTEKATDEATGKPETNEQAGMGEKDTNTSHSTSKMQQELPIEPVHDAPAFGTIRKIRGIQGNTDLDLFQGSVSSLIRTTCSGGL